MVFGMAFGMLIGTIIGARMDKKAAEEVFF